MEVPQDIEKYYRAFQSYIERQPRYNHRISISVQKLSKLSLNHLSELSSDIFDEISRREEFPNTTHLQPRPDIHKKRNNARYQFGDLDPLRVRDMCRDLVAELVRRFPSLAEDTTVPEIPPLHRTRTVGSRSASAQTAGAQTASRTQATGAPIPSLGGPGAPAAKNLKQTEVVPTKSTMVMDSDEDDSEYEYFNPEVSDTASVNSRAVSAATEHSSAAPTSHIYTPSLTSKKSFSSVGRTPFEERLAASGAIQEAADFEFQDSKQAKDHKEFGLGVSGAGLGRNSYFSDLRDGLGITEPNESQADRELNSQSVAGETSHDLYGHELDTRGSLVSDGHSVAGDTSHSLASASVHEIGHSNRDIPRHELDTSQSVTGDISNSPAVRDSMASIGSMSDSEPDLVEYVNKLEDQVKELEQVNAQTIEENQQLHNMLADTESERKQIANEVKVLRESSIQPESRDSMATDPRSSSSSSTSAPGPRGTRVGPGDERVQALETQLEELGLQHENLLAQYQQLQDQHQQREIEHSQLQSQHQERTLQYKELSTQHSQLSAQHSDLRSLHSQHAAEFSALKEQHAALVAVPATAINVDTLTQEHESLIGRHNELGNKHAALSTEHQSIKHEYATLQEAFTDLQVRYANAQNEQAMRDAEPTSRGLNIRSLDASSDNSEYTKLLEQHNTLLADLDRQREITEQVRREAQRFLSEMREMTESRPQLNAGLQTQLANAEQQVVYWKNRYQKSLDETRTNRTRARESMLLQPTAISDKFFDSNGLVPLGLLETYQNQTTQLLQAARTSPETILQSLHSTIISVEDILGEIPSDDTKFAKETRLVTTTAQQLISSTRNFAEASPVFPVAVVTAACSDLSFAVSEFLKSTKVRHEDLVKYRPKSSLKAAPASAAKLDETSLPRAPYSPESTGVADDANNGVYSSPISSPSRARVVLNGTSPVKTLGKAAPILAPAGGESSPHTSPSSSRDTEYANSKNTTLSREPSVSKAYRVEPGETQSKRHSHRLSQSSPGVNSSPERPTARDVSYISPAPVAREVTYVSPREVSYVAPESKRVSNGDPVVDRARRSAGAAAGAAAFGTARAICGAESARPADLHIPSPSASTIPVDTTMSPTIPDTPTTPPGIRTSTTTLESKTPQDMESTASPVTPKIGRAREVHLNSDSTVSELQVYLEEQTSETVDSIRGLLSGIKVDSIVAELKPRVDSIVYYVDLMVNTTGACMERTENWMLKDKGSFILQNLDDCCRRMGSLRENLDHFNAEEAVPRPLKQRLAAVSFDIAKCTKELVKTVEDVSLKGELESINARLQNATASASAS